jgi:cAMP phosphodiesterase
MTSSSNAHIDQLILAVAKPKWLKVAMVIVKVQKIAEKTDFKISDGALAARISALCTDGRLESQGNLSKWRYSEVRIPAKADHGHPESNA